MISILWGLAGSTVLIGILYLFSENRSKINVRTIAIGYLLQVVLGFVVFKWSIGINAIQSISNGVEAVMGAGNEGLRFVFGELANPDGPVGSIFVINVLTIMVGGLASVSGAVLFGLAALGVPIDHMLSAAIMSAPAGLMMAKLMVPETEELSDTEWEDAQTIAPMLEGEKSTVMDAIITGSRDGVDLTVNAAMVLISIIGLVALVDVILGGAGSMVGIDGLSLRLIFSYLFSPLAFVIGVPMNEALMAGQLLGEKLILNEFVAFTSFVEIMPQFTAKSQAIITFALSGFANLGSIGMVIGIMIGIAPERKNEIQDLAMKSLLAGTFANLLNGAIVGMFFF